MAFDPTTFDVNDFQEVLTPEEELEARNEDRKKTCAQWTMLQKHETGVYKRSVWRCRQFRECDNCRDWRINQEIKKLQQAQVKYGQLYWFSTVQSEDATKIIRNLDGPYRRYPIMDGQTVVVYTSLESSGDLVPIINIDHAASILAVTPKGKRLSGNLFDFLKKEPEVKKEIPEEFKEEIIERTYVYPDHGEVDVIYNEALRQVIQAAHECKPLTSQELLNDFHLLFMEFCEKDNFKIKVVYRTPKTIDIRDVLWGDYSPYETRCKINAMKERESIATKSQSPDDFTRQTLAERLETNDLLFG